LPSSGRPAHALELCLAEMETDLHLHVPNFTRWALVHGMIW